ncbi:energy-coupling factor transport system ATP-binding protein [Pseudonocardia autotrophica]|uniref:Putative HMP/thiamine import ATP-binding protein YkoD n=1 Tax=Pseudonocardia autotrophica TaxID=2074 RepID=A0A1Y2N0L9_PSEAH|nr:putative HMP/thiamine import ATP-binding protein YkoD [Pseudonocardia autotrophica]TDN71861.1 energy-coupling factor transport system ATP-binding protein [Pseudonocardia autotrophica]
MLVRARGVRVRHETAESWRPDGVDLDVRPGEVVLLLGPSGCGKSTLSLALGDLVPRSVPADLEGTVVLGPAPDGGPLRVGMVFQDPDAQVVTGTVFDEVCFGPENLCLPVDEIERTAHAALAAVGLTGRERDDPGVLSGGGRQRLALACALALRPRLLVLDEPTANLDPHASVELYRLVDRLRRDPSGELGVLVVEHELDDVVEIADRVVVLDGAGRPVTDGGTTRVFREEHELLAGLGVWLPTAVQLARRLSAAGVRFDPPPVTLGELADGLAGRPDVRPVAASPGRVAATTTPATGKIGTPATGKIDGEDPASPIVRARDLTVVPGRGREPVLRDVSLTVAAGEILAVAGVNGAGKTTLAQALAGVRPPPPGTVDVAGLDVGRAGPRAVAAVVAFVFQNPEHQFLAPTVADELAHGLRVRHTEPDEVDQRVAAALDRFGLGRYRGHSPWLLSHGEKRRLSVASALITGPRVLVLDEPTFGQDRARATELMALLSELNADGTTVVMVSHDLQLVAEHAGQLAVLADGRLLAHGPTGELLTDDRLLAAAGLRPPPLRRLAGALAGRNPAWARVYRTADLPGPGRDPAGNGPVLRTDASAGPPREPGTGPASGPTGPRTGPAAGPAGEPGTGPGR